MADTTFDSAPAATHSDARSRNFIFVCLAIWSAYLLFSSLKALSDTHSVASRDTGGMPGIGDFLLLFLGMFLMFQNLLVMPRRMRFAYIFVGITTTVNLTWFILTYDTEFAAAALYYPYDLFLCLTVISLYSFDPEKFSIVTRYSILAAFVFQAYYIASSPVNFYRALGTFSNPNQLGYWALTYTIIYLLATRRLKPNLLVDAVALGAGLLLSAYSLSKSSLVSQVFVVFGFIVERVRTSLLARGYSNRAATGLPVLLAVAVLAIAAISFYAYFSNSASAAGRVVTRFEEIGHDSDDNVYMRGYNRIWDYPEYLITGAGEGQYWRFSPLNLEIHSSFATVLFSYGYLGFLVFLLFIAEFLRGRPAIAIFYFLPLASFGIAHQGIRPTIFWLAMTSIGFFSGKVPKSAPHAIAAPRDEDVALPAAP